MKKLMIASAVALATSFGLWGAASPAKAEVIFHLGIPHFSFRMGPDYRYREGWGWYNPRYDRNYGRLSCGEARQEVRDRGFRRIRTIECRGRTYTFSGLRRGDRRTVYVNARTGNVWAVR